MAHKSAFAYLVLFAFLPSLAISSPHQKHHKGLKYVHFTLYQPNIFKETERLVVSGIPGTEVSDLGLPFGAMTVLHDNLTLAFSPSSKVVGNAQTILTAASFKTLDSLMFTRYELDLGNGHSGTISVQGGLNTLKPSDLPVTGGTGHFLFVQGFVTTSNAYLKDLTIVYKLDFHLFWPPYASHALKLMRS